MYIVSFYYKFARLCVFIMLFFWIIYEVGCLSRKNFLFISPESYYFAFLAYDLSTSGNVRCKHLSNVCVWLSADYIVRQTDRPWIMLEFKQLKNLLFVLRIFVRACVFWELKFLIFYHRICLCKCVSAICSALFHVLSIEPSHDLFTIHAGSIGTALVVGIWNADFSAEWKAGECICGEVSRLKGRAACVETSLGEYERVKCRRI